MRMHRIGRAAGITAATALVAIGTISQATASPSARNIGDGYHNNKHAVWCVQHLVNDVAQRNSHGRPLAEDGLWGPRTKSWVKWYQGVEGLPRDGVVGKGTGGWLLLHGDTYYGHRNYCYKYVPSVF
ncbi:peptidoglycan-binding domain-containing protein [Streptomyces mirabilis]|uniref:peptidoglycan-binding domain-containing protein n=1 Tax=Streptomyces mirabilis TaxID=68239 RepID=UPI0036E4DE3E